MKYPILAAFLLMIWFCFFIAVELIIARPKVWMPVWTAAGAIPCLAMIYRRKTSLKGMLITIAMLSAFFAAMHAAWRTPVGRFKDAYAAIQVGMTKAQVEAILRSEFPHASPPNHMDETGGFIGPPPDGPNAEFISVQINDGRVTGKDYLPD